MSAACEFEPCAVCGAPVPTCERADTYPDPTPDGCTNPDHREGVQLHDERWVCSEKCWNARASVGG